MKKLFFLALGIYSSSSYVKSEPVVVPVISGLGQGCALAMIGAGLISSYPENCQTCVGGAVLYFGMECLNVACTQQAGLEKARELKGTSRAIALSAALLSLADPDIRNYVTSGGASRDISAVGRLAARSAWDSAASLGLVKPRAWFLGWRIY